MEFEKNKPTTEQDIALAAVPPVTINPISSDIKADMSSAPGLGNAEAKRTFEFETESTNAAAQLNAKLSSHPHHRLAIVVALIICIIFAGIIVLFYVFG